MIGYFPNFTYTPSDDTYQTLNVTLTLLKLRSRYDYFIEVGSGSGYIIINVARSFNSFKRLIATDVNCTAVRETIKHAEDEGLHIDAVCCNLTDCLRSLNNSLIVFNTPYLTCSDDELNSGDPAYVSICRNYRGDVLVDLLNVIKTGCCEFILTISGDGLEYLISLIRSIRPLYFIDLLFNSHMFFEDTVTVHLTPEIKPPQS
ncbi:methyltransferase [Caldivirga maquilingensis]|uniref:Uncharacterized protein n=1 Tax=Caldivirga maquilingensis (strain ATCC 700844 / DSM 13496 / JCM 10307 / IC-167) TaxID=397948 RepID=A8MBV0_CALMQ|nr:methyltransferase [Caldivirga maquilingensis]ABW01293.1 hypothetical protein Cmaq_0448 [Caldivirga maquilingensis IC-167]